MTPPFPAVTKPSVCKTSSTTATTASLTTNTVTTTTTSSAHTVPRPPPPKTKAISIATSTPVSAQNAPKPPETVSISNLGPNDTTPDFDFDMIGNTASGGRSDQQMDALHRGWVQGMYNQVCALRGHQPIFDIQANPANAWPNQTFAANDWLPSSISSIGGGYCPPVNVGAPCENTQLQSQLQPQLQPQSQPPTQAAMAPAVQAPPRADALQALQAITEYFDHMPNDAKSMFVQSLQQSMAIPTTVSQHSSAMIATTVASAAPSTTASNQISVATAVTTAHSIPISSTHTAVPPPTVPMGFQRYGFPAMNYSMFPWPNYVPQPSFTQPRAAPMADPLFAKTEMPKITTKNTEHSIAKLESWLDINGVHEDDRRYQALKMQLDTTTYTQVNHAIYHPPSSGKFDHLKRAVIKVFTDSESKKVQDLISGLQLGDKKPTTLLSEMRNLHRGPLDDKIFRELWLKRLPHQVQTILVGMMKGPNSEESLPLESLAECADNIMEYHSASGSIHAISQTTKSDPMSDMTDILSRISARLEKLENNRRSERNSRSQSRSDSKNRGQSKTRSKDRGRSPTPVENKSDDETQPCVSHVKYGKGQHLNWNCKPKCPLYREWLQARLEQSKNE